MMGEVESLPGYLSSKDGAKEGIGKPERRNENIEDEVVDDASSKFEFAFGQFKR